VCVRHQSAMKTDSTTNEHPVEARPDAAKITSPSWMFTRGRGLPGRVAVVHGMTAPHEASVRDRREERGCGPSRSGPSLPSMFPADWSMDVPADAAGCDAVEADATGSTLRDGGVRMRLCPVRRRDARGEQDPHRGHDRPSLARVPGHAAVRVGKTSGIAKMRSVPGSS